MKLTKLSLAMASVIGAGFAADAMALDLYVDTKTQQIFAEPGKGRVLLGEFQRVGDAGAAAKPAESAELKAEIQQIKEDLALKNNELKALDEHMKTAEEVKVKMDSKGLQVESADKDFKFKLGGRIHADAAYHSGDDLVSASDLAKGKVTHAEANDGTEIRRARMEMQGTFFKDWEFRTVADFADNKVAMKDVYLRYAGWDLATITAGQQKQNFSRELMESSNDLMFMERSLMDVLVNPVADRALGLNLNSKGKDWTAALGIFGNAIDPARACNDQTLTGLGADGKEHTVVKGDCALGNGAQAKAAGDEGFGISSRLTYAPIQEKDKVVHLGLAGNYRTGDDNGDVAKSKQLDYAYKSSHGSGLTLIESKVTDVDSIKMMGLEASGLYGPFYAGGEYTRSWVDRDAGLSNFTADGWYAEAAWSITGESRKYKDGTFKYLEPAKKFSPKNGGWGAWELAGRYSQVNLGAGNPADEVSASNITMAINWYINTNFRLMADYSRTFDLKNAKNVYPDGAQPENMDVYMFRGQVAF